MPGSVCASKAYPYSYVFGRGGTWEHSLDANEGGAEPWNYLRAPAWLLALYKVSFISWP